MDFKTPFSFVSLGRSVLLACGLLFAPTTQAAVIPVTYLGAIIEGDPGIDQGLPFFLGDTVNNIRFKYFVPNYWELNNITSINASVEVYDDDDLEGEDTRRERGELLFVLNGVGLDNLSLDGFITVGSPGTELEFAL